MEIPEQPQSERAVMQHRAYQPLQPAGNKYLQQKWDKASYDLHRRKVESAKAVVNTSPPKTYGHLALKLKKQQLEEEWTRKIERENDMLMEKIAHIMRTTGAVDNKMYYDRKSTKKRQQELLRITKENERILSRVSQCRPHYNVQSWHEDWLKTLKMMDRITRYPQRRANYQKGQYQGQEMLSRRSTGCDEEEKISSDASNHTNGKATSEENEKSRDTEETASETQQDIDTQPFSEPDVEE
ncbi:sperm axonemal maintenance protein CFAP97D1 isoform X2 [Betta splendens]|uniref:Sperm axonemal maintenance protein CFAP97D1 isoform X2 n=1 Tax=Betta splendens TaxID=158456 RepID=A0A6P7LGA8_BETSP|nr:sperm axonemal maintenance protein CFAP97D1 isoform X2 [Betta splendens]